MVEFMFGSLLLLLVAWMFNWGWMRRYFRKGNGILPMIYALIIFYTIVFFQLNFISDTYFYIINGIGAGYGMYLFKKEQKELGNL